MSESKRSMAVICRDSAAYAATDSVVLMYGKPSKCVSMHLPTEERAFRQHPKQSASSPSLSLIDDDDEDDDEEEDIGMILIDDDDEDDDEVAARALSLPS